MGDAQTATNSNSKEEAKQKAKAAMNAMLTQSHTQGSVIQKEAWKCIDSFSGREIMKSTEENDGSMEYRSISWKYTKEAPF